MLIGTVILEYLEPLMTEDNGYLIEHLVVPLLL